MAFASAIARPLSEPTHVLNCMAHYIPRRGNNVNPYGEFLFSTAGGLLSPMVTVEETRRTRLQMLVKKLGSMASLCEKLGYARTETAGLTRILNANVRHDRDGQIYRMGSPTARHIEEKLSLEVGWMDTPPTYAELHEEQDPRTKVMLLMEAMPPDQWATVVRLVDALAQPTAANGTTGQQ